MRLSGHIGDTLVASRAPVPGVPLHVASRSGSRSWLPLRRELFSITLDPVTRGESKRGFLPVGALVENAARALVDAVASGAEMVDVRVRRREDDEHVSLERVGVAALRLALRA